MDDGEGSRRWRTIGLLLGAAVALPLAAVLAAVDPDPEFGFIAKLIGAWVLTTPMTLLMGYAIGRLAEIFTGGRPPQLTGTAEVLDRARRKVAERAKVRSMRSNSAREPASSIQAPDHGPWLRTFQKCQNSVTKFHAIALTVADGPAKEWLLRLSTGLFDKLAEASELANQGQAIAPTRKQIKGPTAKRLMGQLTGLERSFAEMANRAETIANEIRPDGDFETMRAHLELLEQEAPWLRNTGTD